MALICMKVPTSIRNALEDLLVAFWIINSSSSVEHPCGYLTPHIVKLESESPKRTISASGGLGPLYTLLSLLFSSLLSVSTLSLIIPGEEEALSPNGGAKQCNGVSKTRILVADQGQDDDEKYE
ncbi:hypothetical protein SDJN02_05114 [Cucurbita argyrosperma subsp. argyrosperma]|nr:hypothetical protein SDJN02_05114 [Cucurbita argyrosperma subsp. argyrosperma]